MSHSEDADFPDSDSSWVQWFCSLQGHEFYAEVDEDYLRDNFNLYGLRAKVANFE
jgi:casein kinase II subunit beta